MTLLQEIQLSATRSDVRLADLLRKCLLLSWRLNSKELEQWANSELTGYSDDNVPSYRIMHREHFFANLHDGYRSGDNIPVSIGVIAGAFPERWKEITGPAPNRQSVAELEEALIDFRASNEGRFRIMWLTHDARKLDDKVFKGFYCLEVWCEIFPGQIVEILDNIKTRIMYFANDIEKENPYAGEAGSVGALIPHQTVNQIINQHFYDTVANLATGSSNFQQSSN